jgi:hypothetical protein
MCCCLCITGSGRTRLRLRLNLVVKFFSRADASPQALWLLPDRKMTFAPSDKAIICVESYSQNWPPPNHPANAVEI